MENYNNYEGYRRRKNRNFVPFIAVLVILIGIAATAGFLVRDIFFSEHNELETAAPPNMEEINFFAYPNNANLDHSRINAIINGEIFSTGTAPVFIEGVLHFPADFLRRHIDNHIFWENNTSRLTISNFDEIMRFYPNVFTYTVNWEERPLDSPTPIREVAGMAYLPVNIITDRYPVTITHHPEYNFVTIDFHRDSGIVYEIILNADDESEEYEEDFVALRFGSDDQYPIMARLNAGDEMLFLDQPRLYDEDENFIGLADHKRVRTENGLMGYVAEENLRQLRTFAGVPENNQRRPITRQFDEPINFAWHFAGVNNRDSWVVPPGMNAISPTWFNFHADLSGNLVSGANQEYLNWARANGMEVWPMFWDTFGAGDFSSDIGRTILPDAYKRDHVISQIMGFVEQWGLDGIQVDFEVVPEEFADHWIQFLRELSVPMRQADAILSVAAKVPVPHNMWWNRTEIANTVDYVVIMAYDEHWATSPIAGPVASYGWVQHAITATMEEVPAEQIIVGLPTYANIWREAFTDGEWSLTEPRARQVSFNFARDFIDERGGELVWDYIIRQYYSEINFEENGIETRYRIWLEDMRSMDEKLNLVGGHDVAGVAWWQKFLAHAELWDLANEHINRWGN